ncbi:MAG: signal peptidase I [Firmicutes bacterium]|nr:signal peptidase I [Bacillota bacterium]
MAKSELREYIEAFIIAVLLALFIITFIAQSFRVEGNSMEPSLHDGQRLLVEKVSYRFNDPEPGDIIVFVYPSDPHRRRKFIKRVVGVAGDEIMIRNGALYVNGVQLDENYIHGPTYGPWNQMTYGPVTVPEDSFFVLGDNRRNSDDSRYPDVGFINKKDIVGKAILVYWPIPQAKKLQTPQIFK